MIRVVLRGLHGVEGLDPNDIQSRIAAGRGPATLMHRHRDQRRLAPAKLTPAAINSAQPAGAKIEGDDPSPLGVRLQVLLDRAYFSPGEIDGRLGENAKTALRAYFEAQQRPSSDLVTDELWSKLAADGRPALTGYTLTKKHVDGPFLKKLPRKMEAMKSLPRLG